MRLQEDGAQSRTQRQGVQRGETDGDGHCKTELPVERTGCTTHKTYRHEHRHHYQCNGDDGAAQFTHGVDRGGSCRFISLVELGVNTLDDDYGVVHHNRDGKHHGREGQQVDTEPDQLQYEEGGNQGHRNGNSGNQRRTHILQEDIHHDEHENKCFDQGLDNLVDRSEQEVIGTLCNIYLQTGRQRFGCFAEHLFQVADCLRCIGSGHLVYDTGHSLVAVYRIVEVIGQTSELYVGNVFHAKHFAVFKSLDNDVLKLLRLLETAFVADGVLETLVTAFTKLAGGCFNVLFGQCAGYVAGYQFILCHYVRFQPDAHGVILTEDGGVTHSVHTFDFRNEVDVGIVLKEFNVILVFLIIDGEYHQHGSLPFLRGNAHLGYFGGQQTLSHGHAILHVDGCHIRVGALFEVNGDFGRTVIGCIGGHVHHVLHTVDLVFQRCDDRIQHRLGIGALVGGTYRHCRRCNVRILGDRQCGQTNKSQDHYQDGDYR